jgi:hypothetical protein
VPGRFRLKYGKLNQQLADGGAQRKSAVESGWLRAAAMKLAAIADVI